MQETQHTKSKVKEAKHKNFHNRASLLKEGGLQADVVYFNSFTDYELLKILALFMRIKDEVRALFLFSC